MSAPAGRRTCSIPGCGRSVLARGWCNRHYCRWREHGDPLAGRPRAGAWTRRELERLGELLDRGWDTARIAAALGRSEAAVKHARLRNGLRPAYRRASTARQVAALLGVHHMTPQRWIDDGRLPVSRRAPHGRTGALLIDHFDLCAFLSDERNWHCYEPAAIVDPQLRAWTSRLRGDVRFVTVKEAARRLGVGYTTVGARAARLGIELPRDGGIVWVREADLAVLGRRPEPHCRRNSTKLERLERRARAAGIGWEELRPGVRILRLARLVEREVA